MYRENAVILLVEDRLDDVSLITRSLQKAGVVNPLQVVRNGEDAIAYLKGEGKFANRDEFPLPELVLLDLKMPGIDGFEVLSWIRMEPGLSGLRVVVLTSSEQIKDVNRAYALGANSFLVKPMDFNHYVEMGAFIYDYWLDASKAPETVRRERQAGTDGAWISKQRKVFLRHRDSRQFYAGNAQWTGEDGALDFERIDLAESVALAENLYSVEVVLRYAEPGCEITLPVTFPGVRH